MECQKHCSYCYTRSGRRKLIMIDKYYDGDADYLYTTICLTSRSLVLDYGGADSNTHTVYSKINYCPICGRKLGD